MTLSDTGPDLGGEPGGPGAQASHKQGVFHQTPQFLKPRNSIANPGFHNFCYQIRHWAPGLPSAKSGPGRIARVQK